MEEIEAEAEVVVVEAEVVVVEADGWNCGTGKGQAGRN